MKTPAVWVAVIAVALAGAIAAQERPAGQGFSFRSGVSLINVTVTVTDQDGHFVGGLGQDDFEIYEDGVLQTAAHFDAERVPVSLGIAVDTSGVWVTGQTESQDFPATPGSVQPTKAMNEDVFLAKLGSASGPTEPGARMTVYLPLVQR